MTKFDQKSFGIGAPKDGKYRDNWDSVFGKKEEPEECVHDWGYCPQMGVYDCQRCTASVADLPCLSDSEHDWYKDWDADGGCLLICEKCGTES